jgi:hypothetical protein
MFCVYTIVPQGRDKTCLVVVNVSLAAPIEALGNGRADIMGWEQNLLEDLEHR